jgi:hypothetical protein
MNSLTACDMTLATIDWSHAVLQVSGKPSAYALCPTGKFARYLRGDCVPDTFDLLYHSSQHGMLLPGLVVRFNHPLYVLLSRTPRAGMDMFVASLQPWLQCRVADTAAGYGSALVALRPTRRRLFDLAVQGDGIALAALLAYCSYSSNLFEQDLAFEAARRSWQCLLISLASGEFYPLARLLTMRIRQQVIDRYCSTELRVFDTATPDPAEIVRDLKRLVPELETVRGPARRRLIKGLLEGDRADVSRLLSLEQVSFEEFKYRTQRCAGPVDLDAEPRGRFSYIAKLGARGKRLMAEAFAQYWSGRPEDKPLQRRRYRPRGRVHQSIAPMASRNPAAFDDSPRITSAPFDVNLGPTLRT